MEQYYSIKQVSERTELPASAIRYYEKEGLFRSAARNGAGVRIFTEKEMEWILFLKRLKDMEVSIAKMKEYAYLREQGDCTVTQRKELLQNHRNIVQDKIALLNRQMGLLDDKINYYEELEKTINKGGATK